MLKLIGKEQGSDGHTHNFNKSYEIVDLSYERLVVIDTEGNKINLFPE